MMLSQLLSGGMANTTSSTSADVYAKVNKIMQAQNTEAPKLNAALASDNTKLSGLGKLLNALSSFQSVTKSLSGSGLYASATTSPNGVLSATTSSSSVAGSYAIGVTQLAQGQRLVSKPQASADAAIGEKGSSAITIDFGTLTGNLLAQNGSTKTIVIQSDQNNLKGIASAINAARIGVEATVTQNNAGYTLTLSAPPGSANSMRIGVSGNPAMQQLLGYNPAGTKNLSQTSAAQNAALTINGTPLSSASNTLNGAIDGTTLNLTNTGSTTLQTTRDSAQLTKNVSNLVSMYNTLNASLSGLQQGDLKADAALSQIQGQLVSVINASFNRSGGTSSLSLGEIGISTQKNGALALDTAKLQSAIDKDPAGVAKLFTDNGRGIADSLSSRIQSMIGASGVIQKETAAVSKDIALLNTKKSRLESALTAKSNALVKLYSQQSAQGSSGGLFAATTAGQTSAHRTLFDWL